LKLGHWHLEFRRKKEDPYLLVSRLLSDILKPMAGIEQVSPMQRVGDKGAVKGLEELFDLTRALFLLTFGLLLLAVSVALFCGRLNSKARTGIGKLSASLRTQGFPFDTSNQLLFPCNPPELAFTRYLINR
jgi:hypothetical protein